MADAELKELMARIGGGGGGAGAKSPRGPPASKPAPAAAGGTGAPRDRTIEIVMNRMGEPGGDVDRTLRSLKVQDAQVRKAEPPAAAKARVEQAGVVPPAKRAVATTGGASAAPSNASIDDIDAILSGMNFDPKAAANVGYCAECKKGIPKGTPHLAADGVMYHTPHFLCGNCARPLEGQGYYQRNGRPWCEACYGRHALAHCYACSQAITTPQLLSANSNSYHLNCFNCSSCAASLGTSSYFYRDGLNLCERDFHKKYDVLCAGCGQATGEHSLLARGRDYHPACFKCASCRAVISGSYIDLRGDQLCLACDPRGKYPDDGIPTIRNQL